MFLPTDVIEYLDAPGRPLRILWIDAAGVPARPVCRLTGAARAAAAARSLARRQPRGDADAGSHSLNNKAAYVNLAVQPLPGWTVDIAGR